MKLNFKSVAASAALMLLPLASYAQTAPGTPTVSTAGYTGIFTDLTANMAAVATGPVGLGAFGVLTVGIIFRVVWKLYKKGASALG